MFSDSRIVGMAKLLRGAREIRETTERFSGS
jgi:hypothetical protein